MPSLKLADALAEGGEGDAFEYSHDRVAHFLHDAADAAVVLVGAGAALVELFADATDGGQAGLR